MYVHERLAETLSQQGVTCVFGVLGEDVAKLVLELQVRGVAYYATRHENLAVAMADAYSRTTGSLGVAALTGGPGFSNAITAINCASRAYSKVLVLVGAGPVAEDDPSRGDLRRRGKYFPHMDVCAAAGIVAQKLNDPATALNEATEIVQRAARGRTTVLVLPVDVLDAHAPVTGPSRPPAAKAHETPIAPDGAAVSFVADLLLERWATAHPLILAGRGAVLSGAAPALQRLGELTGAMLATTLPASGLFYGDSAYLGTCGTYSSPLASKLIMKADCVLAFGASLNSFTTYGNSLFPQAQLVHVDVDADALGRFLPVAPELAIRADARLTAEALIAELSRRRYSSTGFRTSKVLDELAAFDHRDHVRSTDADGLVDPRLLMIELDRILPRERIFTVDAGHHTSFSVKYLTVTRPDNFVYLSEAGAIGLGLGAGIGAAVGKPGSLVVVGVGDAGLMMSLGEVETAVRYGLPIVVVVSNDQSLGAEVNFLDLMGRPSDIARISTPPLADVARALGATGITVMSLDDLDLVRAHVERGLAGPLVLDCRIDPTVRGDWVEFVFTTYAQSTPPSRST